MLFEQNKIKTQITGWKFFIAVGVFLLVAPVANGQKKGDYFLTQKLTAESNTTNYKLPGKQFYPIYIPSGTIYFNDSWFKGYVVLENGDRYDDLYLKYNSYEDELITLNARTNTLIMIDKDVISEFALNQKTGQNIRFKKLEIERPSGKNRYFNVLYENKFKLLVWQRTTEVKVSPYKDRNGLLQVSDYVLSPIYYVSFPGEGLERFKLSRGSFFSLFPDKKKEVRKLMRKNRNYLRTLSDYARAVELIEKEFYTD